ncbi:MAG: hypothetical protein F6K52_01515 [Moorea sp. SIO3H5]|nr:hypothetical protein [Moorena sp. SIO3H5]
MECCGIKAKAFQHGKNMLPKREYPKLIRRALMHFPTRYFLLVPVTVLMSLLTVSCSGKKVECQKIIEVANQAVEEAKTLTNGGESSDPQAMLQAADAMEGASQDMESIIVKDEQLQDYQAGFIQMYRNTSKATRDFVEAFKKQDRSAAEEALSNLQKATTPEPKLVADINTYCSAN